MNDGRETAFFDTNIWLYSLMKTANSTKTAASRGLIAEVSPVVSVQVINETCVNLIKKAAFSESLIEPLINAFYEKCIVVPTDIDTLILASKLRARYQFSFWDSLIVASAALSGCSVLYSEDMQHGRTVAGVRIENPFEKA